MVIYRAGLELDKSLSIGPKVKEGPCTLPDVYTLSQKKIVPLYFGQFLQFLCDC